MNPQSKTEMADAEDFIRKCFFSDQWDALGEQMQRDLIETMEEYAQSKLAAATVDDGMVVWVPVSDKEDEIADWNPDGAKMQGWITIGKQPGHHRWHKPVTISQSEKDGGMRWVKASERLPKEDTDVLLLYKKGHKGNWNGRKGVFVIQGYLHTNMSKEKIWFDYTERQIQSLSSNSKNEVLYWQPLPEPPSL